MRKIHCYVKILPEAYERNKHEWNTPDDMRRNLNLDDYYACFKVDADGDYVIFNPASFTTCYLKAGYVIEYLKEENPELYL